ncbi:acyl-CoA N-acyltransferase [Apiospora arundinis]|uniref:Acyl-CoA N-acyltransferase n=1 Tax=Apiospora arundinis TaxID=335852 RepID=A0ABR2HZ19_9PEZI
MAPYHIRGCTVADAQGLAYNNIGAFWESPGYKLLWTGRTLEYVTANAAKRMPRNLLKDRAHQRHQLVVDVETGHIVGYARWILPDRLVGDWLEAQTPAVSAKEEHDFTRDFNEADWSFIDLPNMDDHVHVAKAKYFAGGKEYMELDYLAVHPDDKGRGIASMLVKNGVAAAETMNVDIYMMAYEAGLNVYKKFGFEVLESNIQDLEKWGGEGPYATYMMEKKIVKRDTEMV